MQPRAIHQILPYFGYADAIGNLALMLRRVLREWGYPSEIFAEVWEPRLAKECRPHYAYRQFSHSDNLLILHYSVGGQVNQFVLNLPDRVVIYYHNITPAHYFYAVNGDLARRLEEARRDLPLFVEKAFAIADSPFNQHDLEQMGFRVLGVVPPIFSLEHMPSSRLTQIDLTWDNSETRWLHVGRLAPNKCIHDIVKAFYFYHTWITPRSRLLLVGTIEGMQEYVDALHRLVARLGLDDAVVFTGRVENVKHYYQMADVYISMSEHEGFCIPLIEAMRCDVPVLAYASTSVPSTLGDAGVLVRRKEYPIIAEIAHEVIANDSLRTRLVSRQRERLAAFAPDVVRAQFRECLDRACNLGERNEPRTG